MKKWVKRPHISIKDKNLQNLGLKEKGLNVSILNDCFFTFQIEILMLRSVK